MTENGKGMYIVEDAPIAMGFTFIMPVRKNWPQYKIRDLRRGMTFYHFIKPDTDNLVKFAKDCLQGICYTNDGQVSVYDPCPVKIYGFEPKTIIRIRSLPVCEMLEGERFKFNKPAGDTFWDGLNE